MGTAPDARLGVLLSGSGTTLQNLIDRIEADRLDATVACVVSSRAGAGGLERARNHGIPAYAVPRRDYGDGKPLGSLDDFSEAVWTPLREHEVDLVVMGGFMSLLTIPHDYVNRIMNVHPSLIPAFSGEGMYGHHVHEAVLAYGAKVTGATVHFVDERYDSGPIILQEAVPVHDDDTPDSLASRVQALERELFPKAIQLYAEGRVKVEGRRVRIVNDAGASP
jgi:formyltetrahydrofolate-dependent phosphoribosylglycinamide formyltransferase